MEDPRFTPARSPQSHENDSGVPQPTPGTFRGSEASYGTNNDLSQASADRTHMTAQEERPEKDEQPRRLRTWAEARKEYERLSLERLDARLREKGIRP